jgi:ribokinase
MKQPRIAVVGSVNADMVIKAARLPAPGETVAGGRFVMTPGGKGANQAVAAARLGAEVTLIAKVGRDPFGDQAIAGFEREGIHTDRILRDAESATGIALIIVDDSGQNLIAVASGANHRLMPDDVDMSAAAVRDADALLLQLEIPLATVVRAAQIAAHAGVPVILDPAPAMPLPPELLRIVDYLTPNEFEASRLTGEEIRDAASAWPAAERLLATGVRHAVVTLGAGGALLADSNSPLLIPTAAVEAVDTTAAGDAFNGALAWGLARGLAPKDAARDACLAATLSTTRLGAQTSLPTLKELQEFAHSRSPFTVR